MHGASYGDHTVGIAGSGTGDASQLVPERELVHCEQRGRVRLLTLDDPPTNSYTYGMMRQLDELVLDIRMDKNTDVTVIRGTGEKFFCGGANIKMLQKMDPAFKYWFCRHANETLDRIAQTGKIFIAAVNGHCTGGGLEVAMACDLRFARKDAGKTGLPEVTLGVLPGTGGTLRLTQLIGPTRALDLMLTGRLIDFETAVIWGLFNDAYDDENTDAFMDRILKFADLLCVPGHAAMAAGHIKRSVQAHLMGGWPVESAVEGELMRRLFESTDAHEGLTAFVEKRKPEFTGK